MKRFIVIVNSLAMNPDGNGYPHGRLMEVEAESAEAAKAQFTASHCLVTLCQEKEIYDAERANEHATHLPHWQAMEASRKTAATLTAEWATALGRTGPRWASARQSTRRRIAASTSYAEKIRQQISDASPQK